MRRIVCRFEDPHDFLRQFSWEQAADKSADFAFVGAFSLEPGERIRLTALVSSLREQCDLAMCVLDVVPMAVDAADGVRVFRYRARVSSEDAVWLEAFQQKMSALRRWAA